MTNSIDNPRQPRKPGRPAQKSATMKRVPLTGYRDILTVYGKDPDYYYRWVKDTSANGGNILHYKRAGYTLVDKDEVTVGEDSVFTSEDVGSIVRRQSKSGELLFLMKQPMEYREEDVRIHHEQLDETERHIFDPQIDEGERGRAHQYGKVSLERD